MSYLNAYWRSSFSSNHLCVTIIAACWRWISQAFIWYSSNFYSTCYSSCTKTTSTWLWNAKQFLNKTWRGHGSRYGKLKVSWRTPCQAYWSDVVALYKLVCYDLLYHILYPNCFTLQLVQHKFYEGSCWSVGWYATSRDSRRSLGK